MAKTKISLEAPVYSAAGKKAGTITLAESVFGAKWNADLVHQVVLGMQANARQPWAHTKDRSEISGGGHKPWKQKGTGRARHGSTRSPIWRHGGVTFGPRNEKDYSVKINRKMRVNALFSVLSKKYAAGQVLFVNELALAAPKTKEAREIMTNLGTIAGFEEVGTRRKNALYVVLPKMDVAAKKSFQNMGNVLMGTVSTLNPVDVLSYKYLVLVAPEESVKALEAKLAK
jgi:large subunit ribosomal protein L4